MSVATLPACILDVTRLLSRVGRGVLTGIDRVELAYLDTLLNNPRQLYGLAADGSAQVLLDRKGLSALRQRLAGDVDWGAPDLRARLRIRQPTPRKRALSDLRRLGLERTSSRSAGAMIARYVGEPMLYVNVGHSNLDPQLLSALRRIQDIRCAFFVHDAIPLDHPELTRVGVPEAFASKLQLISRHADLVICNSAATRTAVERHFRTWGRIPPCRIVPLGLDQPQLDAAQLEERRPAGLTPGRPYFVILGTIEPRKNHVLLLDVWQELARELPGAAVPALCIAGSRGWRNEALFKRLDTSPLQSRHVFELPSLPDAAVAALLQGAKGLLFPSIAEGYGLPAAEAAILGTPVICSDLPVFREVLQDFGIFLPLADKALWSQHILAITRGESACNRPAPPRFLSREEHVRFALAGADEGY